MPLRRRSASRLGKHIVHPAEGQCDTVSTDSPASANQASSSVFVIVRRLSVFSVVWTSVIVFMVTTYQAGMTENDVRHPTTVPRAKRINHGACTAPRFVKRVSEAVLPSVM